MDNDDGLYDFIICDSMDNYHIQKKAIVRAFVKNQSVMDLNTRGPSWIERWCRKVIFPEVHQEQRQL